MFGMMSAADNARRVALVARLYFFFGNGACRPAQDSVDDTHLPNSLWVYPTAHQPYSSPVDPRIPAGGTAEPITKEGIAAQRNKIHMRGQDVFKAAVKNLHSSSQAALDDLGWTGDDLDWICPHQANLRIVDLAVSKLGLAKERVLLNIDRVGNTSSASIPILIDEGVRSSKLRPGDNILLCALGAGISWGSAVITL